jgi:hypothetical protein
MVESMLVGADQPHPWMRLGRTQQRRSSMPGIKSYNRIPRPMHDYVKNTRVAHVYAVATQTPLDSMPRLSQRLGGQAVLEREGLRPILSFKIQRIMVGIGDPTAHELARRGGRAGAGPASVSSPRQRPGRAVATTARLLRQPRCRETASGAAADRLNDTPRRCLGYRTSRAPEERAAACCCSASKLVMRPARALAATV